MNESGFYRVLVIKNNENQYFRYQIRNKLLHKEITRKDIYQLKVEVENAGLLWGIVDLVKAKQNSQNYKMKTLTGRYGIQV